MNVLGVINGFVNNHPYYSMLLLMMLSNAISAMPAPNGSGNGYKWLFAFAHSINIPRLIATFNPVLAARMRMMPEEDKADAAGAGK